MHSSIKQLVKLKKIFFKNLSLILICYSFQSITCIFGNCSAHFHGFGAVFIASELGQRVNNAFNSIHLRIEQFSWCFLPVEIKRILPMIICVAQEPVELECSGSISLSREVFKKASQFKFHLLLFYFV